MKVVLLHDAHALDGRPDEQDALVQLNAIEVALRSQGHQTATAALGLDLQTGAAALDRLEPDVVVNLVESIDGQGRLIHLAPSLLDGLGVPYTGATAAAMFLTSHKVWAKRVLGSLGVPTPAWVDDAGRAGGSPAFPGRYIVKSIWEDASLGLDDDSVVDAASLDALARRVAERRDDLGGEAFAEAWIEGREFNLSLLEEEGGPRVLPPAEMCFEGYPPGKPRLVGYRAKWDEDSFEYGHTVRRFDLPAADRGLVRSMEELALRCWSALDLTGYARVDFRVDADGTPFVLEVNANPCLSPDAGFVAAAGHAGLDLGHVVRSILDAACNRPSWRVTGAETR